MKTGRSLQEVLMELNRQNKAKQDYISPAQGMRLREDGRTFEINHLTSNQQEVFGTTPLFHRQVASALGIPAKYYDLMQAQKPTLLAENVNAWFGDKTNSYMVRSMDYGAGQVARALLSERYRRIDNMEIASAVLPLFGKHEKISFLKNSSNLGIATALAQIMEYASQHQADWVLTLDQDSVCRPGLIAEYKKYIHMPSVGMLT